VDGVNLAIQRGRTLGLVGESGSGKTTLSRLIVGLTDATSGNIHLAGADLPIGSRRPRQTLARLQLVFQNPHNALNPYLTIGQALSRPLIRLRGLSQREAKAEVGRLLEAVNLPPSYAARYPSELSGGEKQRVGIARAFAAAPDLVVCDEPVSALDVSVQSAILNLLAALQDENGTAYLFVSHDLAVVGYLADYVAVMYGGQIMEVGYARDVFAPPWHPYTEALIAAIPKPDPSQKTPPVLLTEGEALPARGCRFAGRCPRKLGAVCEQEAPPWQDEGDAHFIRCHIPLSELRAAQSHAQKEPKG
jgi:peptide/nickel transport system ATP-binding protein